AALTRCRQNGIDQFGAAFNVLVTHEPGHFHVPVIEHVDLDTLSDDRHGHENGVWSMPTECISQMCTIQPRQQVKNWMSHAGSHFLNRLSLSS
ncbi:MULTISPECIES: hypothetical protein, partial [unclassified Burkholderia]|uniref:hypothetical protein n=1 Tax=Burkholderia sp. LMG 13014 TaxID=2709306 RepID=UPI0019639190